MIDGLDAWTNRVHHGDAFDLLDELPANAVDAAVTDPPYGLAFMDKDWDDFEPREFQEWCQTWGEKTKRVLKPGAHLLAFGGNRTHHRLFTGLEEAGFVIRDTITFHYGNGMPRGANVRNKIDYPHPNPNAYLYHQDDWETQLKPATEFVAVAQKPVSEQSIVKNALQWLVGALNIGETRIDGGERPKIAPVDADVKWNSFGGGEFKQQGSQHTGTTTEGRHPANVVFDRAAAARLDRQVGELDSGSGSRDRDDGGTDTGGPSRFFYTSKASRADRTLEGRIENAHPTKKPSDLCQHLVKLVTAEGQTVLDPFCGTGTIPKAAKDTGREFIAFERLNTPERPWADVARVTCGLDAEHPEWLRPDRDDGQTGFEEFADATAAPLDGGDSA